MDSTAWDERYADSALVWSATPNLFVEAELGGLPPGRALDLATGEGRNAIWLAARGWRVTAVDFSAAGLDKARTVHAAHARSEQLDIDWVHADVLEYDPDPGGYDLALLAYLQLSADQRRESVRRAFDALAPVGTLFVVAHDSTNLTEGTGGPQDPSVLFTADDILDDLAGYDFDVERAERVARTVVPDEPSHQPSHEPSHEPSHRHPGEPARTAYDALVRLRRV